MFRTPSVKTLAHVFDNAKEAKRILRMNRKELEETIAGRARVQECYNRPTTEDVRLHVLDAMDIGLHGVESIDMGNGQYADYLNTGDSYAATLIFWNGSYRVQSVGDFVEVMERQGYKIP
jgi:hypothetical protein